MPDATRRAARTFIQGIPAGTIVTGLLLWGVPLSVPQAAWLTAALTALASLAMNLLEDASGKAVLKTPPVPAARRRRDPIGH